MRSLPAGQSQQSIDLQAYLYDDDEAGSVLIEQLRAAAVDASPADPVRVPPPQSPHAQQAVRGGPVRHRAAARRARHVQQVMIDALRRVIMEPGLRKLRWQGQRGGEPVIVDHEPDTSRWQRGWARITRRVPYIERLLQDMLIKFSTRFGHLLMLGEPAVALLKLGGHSGTVPSAVLAADLPAFLQRLRQGLEVHGDEVSPPPPPAEPDQEDGDEPRERPISLHLRAVPLLDMLATAIQQGSDLMWERA